MEEGKLRVLTNSGVEFLAVSDADERSTLGSYWNAVRNYLRTGDDSGLWQFDNEAVAGRPLQTDPDVIELWARRGELDFDDIYRMGG